MKLSAVVSICITAALAAACGTANLTTVRGDAAIPSNATVIDRNHLQAGGADLLRVIVGRVPGLLVDYSRPCPELQLRGRKGVSRPPAPSIFVNGTRTSNTCVLTMIRPDEVARVEVYPGGITRRPGYTPNSDGLILVFLRRAEP